MGVKLHVDLETLQLIQGPGQRSAINTLRFKRGDAARLQVVFLENGITPVTIGDPGILVIQIGIKPRNQFDRSYLAHSEDWSMPSEGDDTPAYGCSISFNTLQLNSALNVGSATAEELPEVTLMGEITWREGSGEPSSTRTFLVVVENDVNRGTEGAPTDADPPYPAPELLLLLSNNDWLTSKAVRYDTTQTELTAAQRAQFKANLGENKPYNAPAATGNYQPDLANGEFQKTNVTDAVTLRPPLGGSAGSVLKLWLTASGADRWLSLDAAIKVPSDSGLVLPKTMTVGKLYIIQLQHNGTNWMLTSLVGGY